MANSGLAGSGVWRQVGEISTWASRSEFTYPISLVDAGTALYTVPLGGAQSFGEYSEPDVIYTVKLHGMARGVEASPSANAMDMEIHATWADLTVSGSHELIAYSTIRSHRTGQGTGWNLYATTSGGTPWVGRNQNTGTAAWVWWFDVIKLDTSAA